MRDYHQPVMLKEALDFLKVRAGGIYVDATLGGGGHAEAILKTSSHISLVAFDQDPEAISHCRNRLKDHPNNLILIRDNFSNLRTRLSLERIRRIDGILFDLGVSSRQIDDGNRGFSFEREGILDMRMDQEREPSALKVINTFSSEKLKEIFYEYGEEPESGRIAATIVKARAQREIRTTAQLAEIIEMTVRTRHKIKSKARIFQALRIFVNSELDSLKTALRDSVHILKPGARIVVIAYHSLEDRIVKRYFLEEEKECICPPRLPQCVCGKTSRLKVLTRKPLKASEAEIALNSRARSSRLRAAEKKEVS